MRGLDRRLRKLEHQKDLESGSNFPEFIMRNGIDRTLEILKEFKEAREKGVSFWNRPHLR